MNIIQPRRRLARAGNRSQDNRAEWRIKYQRQFMTEMPANAGDAKFETPTQKRTTTLRP